ncbi:MAG TPA: AAA family ATPase [Tepidisphaeraceae bacterium]|jgi:capsular exopolysaccharide synthesis family protein
MRNSGNKVPVYRQVESPVDEPFAPVVMNLNQDAYSFPAPDLQPAPAAPAAEEGDVVEKVKFALRGRWVLAVVLAVVVGPIAAYVGYGFKPVTYKSEGTIQIPYLRPKVLQGSEADQPMVLFDSLLTAQAQRLKGRGVVDAALLTPAWQKTGRGNSERTAVDFSVHVSAEHPVETELIKIAFVDQDPVVAAAGVNAVIAAFSQIYTQELRALDTEKMQQLEARRQDLSARLEKLEARMEAEMPALPVVATPASSTTLPSAVAPVAGSAVTPQQDLAPVTVTALGPERFVEIAKTDQVMREYLYQQDSMKDVLAQMKDVYGNNHPEVIRKTKELARFTEKLYQYAANYRAPVVAPVIPAPVQAQAPAPTLAPSTQPSFAQVQMSPRYEALKNDARTVRDSLNETIRRVETLRMEGNVGRRVAVISSGEVPVSPFSDSRLKYAAVGGAAGAALPVGLLILLGLIGRTYRFSTDAEETATDVPLLGILPILTEGREENEKRADAAHCVHQIRAILQMRRPMQSAYMVTSAAAGEGKTSLTAALAFAFAAAGSRVLIIDADLVGQRLTGGFKSDRQLGLHDLISGSAKFAECIKRIDHNLRFMPVGKSDTTLAAWTLSAAAMRKVINEGRRCFDVVLVDTGPVLGSVEAAVVAPEVDGVIFTIARGQQRWLVEKATKHLRSVGGKLIGLVFNRAESRDFNRSAFRSSARSSTMPQEPDWSPRREAPEAQKLGPLVMSVATLLPAVVAHEGNGKGHG